MSLLTGKIKEEINYKILERNLNTLLADYKSKKEVISPSLTELFDDLIQKVGIFTSLHREWHINQAGNKVSLSRSIGNIEDSLYEIGRKDSTFKKEIDDLLKTFLIEKDAVKEAA